MAYATAEQLEAYVGESVTLPSDDEQDRLLERASELVDYVTLGRIDTDDADHTEAAEKAVCAQVEYWLSAGEDADTAAPVQSYSLGSLSLTYGQGRNARQNHVAPRAHRYLFLAGLLYRGVRTAW